MAIATATCVRSIHLELSIIGERSMFTVPWVVLMNDTKDFVISWLSFVFFGNLLKFTFSSQFAHNGTRITGRYNDGPPLGVTTAVITIA